MSRARVTLPDQSVRERIWSDLDSTIFVEAGAGTGKTAVLVGRYVSLIEARRARPRDIAAITFTEKAAAELRERVRRELESRRQHSNDEALRDLYAEAIDELDEAQISTIHSFAQSILASHPLEAGLPPSFTVEDEIAADVEFTNRWEEFWYELLEDRQVWDALKYGFLLGLKPSGFLEVAREFEDNWDRLDRIAFDTTGSVDFDLTPLVEAIDDCLSALPRKLPADDRLTASVEEIASLGDDLKRLEGDDLLVRLDSAQFGSGRIGRAPVWSAVGADVEEIRAKVVAVAEARQTVLQKVKSYVLTTLGERLVRFTLDGAAERAAEGRLKFHDLLVHCHRLLAGNPTVREAVRDRIRYLLIDEFQDTDPLQMEIALLISTDVDTSAGIESRAFPECGRLFLVGDPKQSIYRFRRADVLLYQWAKRTLGGDLIELTSNFRSTKAILNCVDTVFSKLLVEDDASGQVGHTPLHFAREAPVDNSRVMLIGGPVDANAAEVRLAESEAIAKVIRTAVGKWVVGSPDGRLREACFSDVAVLIRGRTSLGQLEASLTNAGIPYRLESRELIYSSQEVRDLISVLSAIADPSDSVAIVGALKSALFACSDKDLLEYSMSTSGLESPWDYTEQKAFESEGGVVADALKTLREYFELQRSMSPSALVEQVVRDRFAMEISGVLDRARDRWRRLRLVVDECRAFLDGGGESLADFLKWVENVSNYGGRGEALLPDPDDDAVRVLTIHAAKGLEFPIAIVAGIGVRTPPSRQRLYWSPSGTAEMQLGNRKLGFGTPGLIDAIEKAKALNRGEEVRLGYVAVTRARDHLVVSLYHSAREKSSLAGEIHSVVEEASSDPSDLPPLVEASRGFDLDSVVADSSAKEESEAWRLEREEIIERASRRRVVSATSVRDLAQAPSEGFVEEAEIAESLPDGAAWRGGRGASAFGRAVHSVLQLVDLRTGAGLSELAVSQAVLEGISDRSEEVADRVRAVIGSEEISAALASKRLWREIYVGVPVGSGAVEGYVDLLYEDEDGFVIIDYKTYSGGDSDLEPKAEEYFAQGASYALAVSEATGKPVKKVTFLFVGPRGVRSFDIPDLEAEVGKVRSELESMLA